MTASELLDLANDPTLIKGIYQTCDQWCMYCRATARCLAFRCNPTTPWMRDDAPGAHRDDDDHDRLFASMLEAKFLADAEGCLAPPEVEVMLSRDRHRQRRMFAIDDPLERMGRRYMMASEAYLVARPDYPLAIAHRATGPTPLEVFVWFHVLVPARIFRALLNASDAEAGDAERRRDALASARSALVGIDRSIQALTALAAEDDDPRVEFLLAHLRRLGPALEQRFPTARAFVRRGLDDLVIG
jgi:hypothetical protein